MSSSRSKGAGVGCAEDHRRGRCLPVGERLVLGPPQLPEFGSVACPADLTADLGDRLDLVVNQRTRTVAHEDEQDSLYIGIDPQANFCVSSYRRTTAGRACRP